MIDKTKEIIKSLYEDMLEVSRLNHPEIYQMPEALYNSICSRVQYLESELVLARKRTESWKKKYMEGKNGG